ncbi:hypothetical protein ACWENS_10395 [Streptomyces sp. NPDC004532]
MLRVEYEATDDLEPGQAVQIDEDRGLIRVRVDKSLDAPAYTAALNEELDRFLSEAEWFQVRKDQILSPQHPDKPVRVVYRIDQVGELDDEAAIEIREGMGLVLILVDPTASVERFVAAMNPAIVKFLSGGRWFQFFAGEIVDMTSPESVSRV